MISNPATLGGLAQPSSKKLITLSMRGLSIDIIALQEWTPIVHLFLFRDLATLSESEKKN